MLEWAMAWRLSLRLIFLACRNLEPIIGGITIAYSVHLIGDIT